MNLEVCESFIISYEKQTFQFPTNQYQMTKHFD